MTEETKSQAQQNLDIAKDQANDAAWAVGALTAMQDHPLAELIEECKPYPTWGNKHLTYAFLSYGYYADRAIDRKVIDDIGVFPQGPWKKDSTGVWTTKDSAYRVVSKTTPWRGGKLTIRLEEPGLFDGCKVEEYKVPTQYRVTCEPKSK